MRRLAAASLALALAVGITACSDAGAQEEPAATPTQTDTSGSGATNNPAAANAVTIQDMAFAPRELTIAAGASVTWTNEDQTTHSVAFDENSITSSPDMENGDTFTATFPTAGTFNYTCRQHPSMKGTIIVQ